jgi:hypothetical protein
MSFGRPGGALDSFRVLPPDRGSFPLDHDGEFFDIYLYILAIMSRSRELETCVMR